MTLPAALTLVPTAQCASAAAANLTAIGRDGGNCKR